jgi:hypothetical protein
VFFAEHKITELADLLPWNWRPERIDKAPDAAHPAPNTPRSTADAYP